MKKKITKTTDSYYEIQYTTIWDDPDVWYPTKHAGENKFKSFVEASQTARELAEEELKNRVERVVSEYRVVEHVVTTTSESLKSFTV
jgi:hypothetical protein